MAEPDAGETHQLLTTHSNSRQHRQDLNVLNQQTIQQSQNQDAKNPQTELKQPQTQTKMRRLSLDIKKSIVICSRRLPLRLGSIPACA